MPTYEFPRPSVATDVVTFRFHEQQLEVLLIERKEAPLGWALPGGFLRVGDEAIEAASAKGQRHPDIDWTLEDCAQRELLEEAGVSPYRLHQFGTYGNADRDPRGRYISVAYWALVHEDRCAPVAGSDAKAVAWRAVTDISDLAFRDHAQIIADAQADMRRRRSELDLFVDLMPSIFTYPMFLEAYQPFWAGDGERDLTHLRSNLHRKIKALWAAAETDQPLAVAQPRGPGAPAKHYDLARVKTASEEHQ